MHFTASAAIIVLVCMASAIDASRLPIAKTVPLRSLMKRPSSQTNVNINTNENENNNFLFSSLISELLANVNSQGSDQDLCESDDDDDSCFWKMIGADVLVKSAKAAQETEDVADDETDKPSTLEKVADNSKSLRTRPVFGPSNYNFNSNSNENSNFDFSSIFSSLQQFLRNKNKKLAKETTVKKD